MTREIDRRQFTSQTAGGLLGLMSGALSTAHLSAEPRNELEERRLVLLGLNALARSPEYNYFADGHRGASLVAAHLLCVDNGLTDEARSRIVELFELNWASKPLCQPYPEADPVPDRIREIGFALAERGDVLLQVGHNAIFAMIAIKAFRMLPTAATPERIDGVCRLIRSFTPWRDVDPDPEIDPPPFSDAKAASRFVLQEALDAIDRFIGYGQGFAGHMLTFGHSLIELAAMGDVEFAESCRTAFCKYVTVTRLGPEPDARRIADHKQSPLRPKDAEYWQRRGEKTLGLGHVFKYPYSYYDLLRYADDPQLQQAWEAKAYHLF